jgi:type IV secretory pathway ATPase VirB11/archaellum biosynthesis ATPase
MFFGSPKPLPKQETIPLGFTIDDLSEGEVVETSNLAIPRSIVKVNNAYFYNLGYGIKLLSKQEKEIAEHAKAYVTDLFAAEAANSSFDIIFDQTASEKARSFAEAYLAGKMEKERAFYISHIVAYDTIGYGPISLLLEDKEHIEEIEVDTPTSPISIYHMKYGRCATNLRFSTEQSFRHSLNKFIYTSEKELNDDNPIIDAQVENARIHAQLKPYAQSGSCATIRLGGRKEMSISMLVKNGTLSAEALAYIWIALESKLNIIISGAPASGKTTLLLALMSFIPRYEKIITIEEDVNELKSSRDYNLISLYGSKNAAFTTRDQVINSLRMRPDRIIIGEVRGAEAKEMFSASNLGMPFITTMHSNEGGSAIIKKLIIKPMGVEPNSLSALDIALYMSPNGLGKRLLASSFEYRWLSRAEIESEEGMQIGDFDKVSISEAVKAGFVDAKALKESKVIAKYCELNKISQQKAISEFSKRSIFLKKLISEGIAENEILERVNAYGI